MHKGPDTERKTMLKIILGTAMGGYGYNPYDDRNPITPEVAEDCDKYGISVSRQTIRKYFNEAKELLPPPQWYEMVTGRKVKIKETKK